MDNSSVKNILKSILSDDLIFENEPMSRHTTFRAGGNAAFFVTPATQQQIADLISELRDVPHMFVGNGSNLLFTDEGYDGVVIQLGSKFADIKVDGNDIIAEAGALLSKIANVALEHGLGGFEFASGIPGSLGGAVAMNAGAYGREMKDVVVKSICVDEDGEIFEIDDHEFSYRHSIFTNKKYLVLKTVIRLEPKDKTEIKAEMTDLNNRRRDKQPIEFPSAGSTFKRPEGYFAGKLIEDAGLKGYTVGGAMVSKKHAGFVINYDNAQASDILEVMEHVKSEVYMQFGVELEPEVKVVGKEQ
ncbi:MAG: UDP-N-acetylmuramate dehydrogenase [Clostridia bacterium]|nr:UDP-N-acetylmuramate dehydrogenase [Clostridia bacterium]